MLLSASVGYFTEKPVRAECGVISSYQLLAPALLVRGSE
jgi:hypothetical protein